MRRFAVVLMVVLASAPPARAHEPQAAAATYAGFDVVVGELTFGRSDSLILYVHERGLAVVEGRGETTDDGPWFEVHRLWGDTYRGPPDSVVIEPGRGARIGLTIDGKELSLQVTRISPVPTMGGAGWGTYRFEPPDHEHSYELESRTLGFDAWATGTFDGAPVRHAGGDRNPRLHIGYTSVTRACTDCPQN